MDRIWISIPSYPSGIRLKTQASSFHFLEISVECGFNEDDAVEKLLHDSVLALVVRLRNSLQFDLRLSVYRRLDVGRDTRTLSRRRVQKGSPNRTSETT